MEGCKCPRKCLPWPQNTRLSPVHVLLPGWLSGKESAGQHRRPGFDSWVAKIHWRRKRQPTEVFLHGEPHGQRSLVGCSPQGRRVAHDRETEHQHACSERRVQDTLPPLPSPSPRSSHALFLHCWRSTWTCSHAPAPASARSWCQEPLRFLLCADYRGRPLPLPTRGDEPSHGQLVLWPRRTAHRRVHLRAVTWAQPNWVPRSPHPSSGSPHGSDTSPLCCPQALLLLLVPKFPTQRRKHRVRQGERQGVGWSGWLVGFQVRGCHVL